MDLKKISIAYVRMATSAVPKHFSARPKSEFGEHASNQGCGAGAGHFRWSRRCF